MPSSIVAVVGNAVAAREALAVPAGVVAPTSPLVVVASAPPFVVIAVDKRGVEAPMAVLVLPVVASEVVLGVVAGSAAQRRSEVAVGARDSYCPSLHSANGAHSVGVLAVHAAT